MNQRYLFNRTEIFVDDFFTQKQFFWMQNQDSDPKTVITCVAQSMSTDDVAIGTSKGDVYHMKKGYGMLLEKF